MIERGDGPRLALEAIREALFRDLDGDDAIQARVARLVDLAL
jgi:hypothetical protein